MKRVFLTTDGNVERVDGRVEGEDAAAEPGVEVGAAALHRARR